MRFKSFTKQDLDLPFYELEPQEIADELGVVVTSYVDWSKGKVKQSKNEVSAQLLKERGRRAPRSKLKDLDYLFHNMPVELFYEILGLLHPIDLIRVARTTKYLRSLVMRHSSSWIWDLAFARNPRIPPCPDDMPRPKWTDLLFGPSICQVCEAGGANADFKIRRRLCDICGYKHVMHHRPEPNETWDLLIFSQPDPAAQGKPDWALLHEGVQELVDKLQTYRHFTASRYHESWKECHGRLQNLLTHPMSKDHIAPIDKCISISKAWRREIIRRSEIDARMTLEVVKTRLRCRVEQLGYHAADLGEVFGNPWLTESFLVDIGVNQRNPLGSIRCDWTKIQPRLKLAVAVMAKNRLATERRELISARRCLVQTLYSRAQDHVGLELPNKLCRPAEILLFHPFVELVDLPSEVTLNEGEWSRAIHRFIENWPPRNMGELALILPSDTVPAPDTFWEQRGIYSASSVFSCVGCAKHLSPGRSPGSCLVGWEEAMDHRAICARLRSTQPFEISERGCTAARSVLACLNLDLDTLPRVLDDLGVQLTCSVCRHRPIFSWWDCIAHFIDTSNARVHDKPSWKVISRRRSKVGAVWRGLLGT